MPIPISEAEHIFSAQKELLAPIIWSTRSKSDRNQLCLECRVRLKEGVIPRGIFFRAVAYPTHLRTYTFQLECERPEARSHVTLYRLEVRPFRQHSNKMYGPDDINGLYFPPGETHEHDFHDSLEPDGSLRENSCEQARSVVGPLQDFATALARVCSRINIINGGDVPSPNPQGALL